MAGANRGPGEGDACLCLYIIGRCLQPKKPHDYDRAIATVGVKSSVKKSSPPAPLQKRNDPPFLEILLANLIFAGLGPENAVVFRQFPPLLLQFQGKNWADAPLLLVCQQYLLERGAF